MATERLSMRHTREILRQKWALGGTHRAVAQSLGVSVGTVGTTVLRARAAGLDWPQVQALTNDALETRLYGAARPAGRGITPTFCQSARSALPFIWMVPAPMPPMQMLMALRFSPL